MSPERADPSPRAAKNFSSGGKMKERNMHGRQGKSLRGVLFLGVLLALMLSCSSMADLSATATPAATNTPEATATPQFTPTETASPTPTATPDLEATQAVEETATMLAAQALIVEDLTAMSIPVEGGRVAAYQSEPIVVSSEGYQKAGYDVLPMEEDVLDAVIHTNVTWTATSGISECGVIFNKVGTDWLNYYEFDMLKLSGLPYWFNAKVSNGIFRGGQNNPTNLIDVKDGATNTVVILVKDKAVSYYVNGKKLITSSDAGLVNKGGFGFVSWQESGSTECTFSDIWVWTWDK
jgi:hypothetical protein